MLCFYDKHFLIFYITKETFLYKINYFLHSEHPMNALVLHIISGYKIFEVFRIYAFINENIKPFMGLLEIFKH